MEKFTYKNRHKSTFYIEDHNQERVFEGSFDEVEKEIDRLINEEEGFWTMYDQNGDEWQSGGLSELDTHEFYNIPKSSTVETFIKKVGGNHCVHLKIDNQTFRLAGSESKEDAEWKKKMLDKALTRALRPPAQQ